jgi:creatinine amidohydrolase
MNIGHLRNNQRLYHQRMVTDTNPAPISRFWADWTTLDFAQLDTARAIAVLPVAATEQHGPHLSLSVDTDLVNGVIQAALPHLPHDLPVLFLPTQSVGFSPEHQAFAGTLSLSSHTVIQLWTDIANSVAASGVRKLVLLNAHGGNVSVMDLVARDVRARLNMLVYSVSWFNLPLPTTVEQQFSAQEHRFGIHAGHIETAMMLALRPHCVQMQEARHFESAAVARSQRFDILGNGTSAKLGWQIQDYHPSGAVGNAAAATAEQGRAVLEAAGQALAQMLKEMDQVPPPAA